LIGGRDVRGPGNAYVGIISLSPSRDDRGWQLPAYTFPANRSDLAVLRVVVRNGFTHDLADLLLTDVRRAVARLRRQPGPVRGAESASFTQGAGPAAGSSGQSVERRA
jgi:glutamate decarboxylase